MKIKFFNKKEKEFKKERSSLGLNLYWKLAVCFLFTAALLSFVFGYYLFMQINKEQIVIIPVSTGQIETVKKERIDNVLQYFSTREQKSSQILNSPSTVIDPSL